MIRIRMLEAFPVRHRFEPPVGDVLVEEPKLYPFTISTAKAEDGSHVDFRWTPPETGHEMLLRVHANPLRLDVTARRVPLFSFNARGLLRFEHARSPQELAKNQPDLHFQSASTGLTEDDIDRVASKAETFKDSTDSKPFGPTSVGVDLTFFGFSHAYGIPEHADRLVLRNTETAEPYRLYNLDVFEYELESPMALYGSVPLLLAHSAARSAAALWLNPSETFVHVHRTGARSTAATAGDRDGDGDVRTRWISEAGVLDLFLLLGPRPHHLFRQYAALTGTTQLPPLPVLGYHQCRWGYKDEEDVLRVDAGMDENALPYDVMWLDLDHTDGSRFFTWNLRSFTHPNELLGALLSVGRRLVTVVDPMVKLEPSWKLYRDARDKDLFVKSKDRVDFTGWCWPGSSSWPDYARREVRDWWAAQFAAESSVLRTPALTDGPYVYTWNDMNEPSVFSGPEGTLPKDALHRLGPGPGVDAGTERWAEHRELHNLYGLYVQMATYEGQLARGHRTERPFVLARSFFAGSQRYGAIWTGDNRATWDHLRMTTPMLLSLSIAGITFVGADIAGFFKNPSPELQVRWYQAAAWHPFFRGHAHEQTLRREPYLLPVEHRRLVRDALHRRQAFAPYVYTLFFENERLGLPVLRPLWAEFPADAAAFDVDDAFLLGSAILVHPIVNEMDLIPQKKMQFYLPSGGNEQSSGPTIWYDLLGTLSGVPAGAHEIGGVSLETVPHWMRGGSALLRRQRVRRALALSVHDAFALWIALDAQDSANGTYYIDDYHSLRYKRGEFGYFRVGFRNGVLENEAIESSAQFETRELIERVVILGVRHRPSKIIDSSPSAAGASARQLAFEYDELRRVLVVPRLALAPLRAWRLVFVIAA